MKQRKNATEKESERESERERERERTTYFAAGKSLREMCNMLPVYTPNCSTIAVSERLRFRFN